MDNGEIKVKIWYMALHVYILTYFSYQFKMWQQYSKQLEETMERFAQGDIRILICTNIVESGLDIQNANTIIIQDVQQFGLAQLYQVFL
jgi:transcription-repair coupling factor (superfamily II helicase)